MSKVIGIDLGTANSCVAIIRDGKAVVVPDRDGENTTPSFFAINAREEPLVGHAAKLQAEMNPKNTIFAVKRFIGKKFKSAEVQDALAKLPYDVVPSPNGDAWVVVNGNPTSPEEVSAEILVRMREIAEFNIGHEVSCAVITVPAHFNDAQRQATKDAGKIAGLQVLGIINEPTAAALAYGIDQKASGAAAESSENGRNIVVFDLGGGTFDITILNFKDGHFDVRSTGGDTYLGGEDIDMAIVQFLLNVFRQQSGIDLSGDRAALQRLKEVAREAKHRLSHEYSTEINLPNIASRNGAPVTFELLLERKQLEQIVDPVLARVDEPCFQALDDAALNPAEIDDVILVGGMTRMPAVKKRCEKIFGKPPIDTVDPDEAVARGAALQAAMLQGVLKGMKLSDVIPLTLGIEVQGGKVVPLLKRNTKIPCSISEMLTTSAPQQREVTIHILQGESEFAPENKSLGKFVLTGIPPQKRGAPRIDLTLEVDGDGIVQVSARDQHSGETKKIEILNTSGLDDSQLEQLVADNRTNKTQKDKRTTNETRTEQSEPVEIPEIERVRNTLKATIFQTQFRLDTEGAHFKGSNRDILLATLASCREVQNEATEIPDLEVALTTLQEVASLLNQYLEAA